MSEYLSRKKFGHLLVTIDTVEPDDIAFRVDSSTAAGVDVGYSPHSDCPADGGTTAINISGVNLEDRQAMLLWLIVEPIRLLAIDATTAECLRKYNAVLEQLNESLRRTNLEIRDLDHMSFAVDATSREDASPAASAVLASGANRHE